jgi:hypothetical protein
MITTTTPEDSNKEAIVEFLGIEECRDFWKVVKQDLHSRILAGD